MDENSRKGETSESVENTDDGEPHAKTENVSDFFPDNNVGVVIDRGSGINKNKAWERVASSLDASGPSSNFPPSRIVDKTGVIKGITQKGEQEEEEEETEVKKVNDEDEDDDEDIVTKLPIICQVHQETEPIVEAVVEREEGQETEETPIGPPPSYSFVMKQKKKGRKSLPPPDPLMPDWPPPPMYGGIQGVYTSQDEGRICNLRDFSSLTEPIWRSHSQPALCPRCGILVLTSIHSHDSIATHVTALALCLFGCWPCCLLPYCMNVCKNTYHHCPICQTFLGAYTPW